MSCWFFNCLGMLTAVTTLHANSGYDLFNMRVHHFDPLHAQSRWIRIPHLRSTGTVERPLRQVASFVSSPPLTLISNQRRTTPLEESRLFKPETISRISETLGALNTVGKYLVNMTKGGGISTDIGLHAGGVPQALYTISKNVLGRNVTDSIAPFVKDALPGVGDLLPLDRTIPTTTTTTIPPPTSSNSCTTPDGIEGYCDDLSDCPQLLLNLSNLRQSLCFKSLFVPGVCCPIEVIGTEKTTPLQIAVNLPVQHATTILPTSTYRVPTTPVLTTVSTTTFVPLGTNFVDPEDCGQPEYAKFRVVGGEDAGPGKWPWMAAIFLHGARRTEFWCGGTLISRRHILTAAHCTRDSRQRPFSQHQFTIRLGDVNLQTDSEPSAPVTYKVTSIKAHKDFTRIGFYNDIAIMELDRPVRKSKYIIPICLPDGDLRNKTFAGRRSTVVGWGTTYYGGKESTIQRQAELPVWRNDDCNQAYFQPITTNFICAGYTEGGTDACQGDSGGPLMLSMDARWVQIGVVSFGNKCGEPGYPGVYTRLTEYLDWIKTNTV